jgi:hypothetical protein
MPYRVPPEEVDDHIRDRFEDWARQMRARRAVPVVVLGWTSDGSDCPIVFRLPGSSDASVRSLLQSAATELFVRGPW